MSDDLGEISVEVMQQRLIKEVEAQQNLQEELRLALESEKQLRLENDVLRAHLEQRHPGRVQDAQDLLERLIAGGNLTEELREGTSLPRQTRTFRQKVRRKLGSLPGVHRLYHGFKNLRS